MRRCPIYVVLCQLILLTTTDSANGACTSCRDILTMNSEAPSGEYLIKIKGVHQIWAYCEMGLNGGGYTFLHPKALSVLQDADIQDIFTNKSSFLMRIRKSDGTQPFAVLTQLPQYNTIPLMIGLNQNTNYPDPVNKAVIPGPYLFFGFLPKNTAKQQGSVQGMTVNDFANTFTNCDGNPNSQIALFPNFKEVTPSTYGSGWSSPFCDTIFSRHQLNPSRRVMPGEYFMFGELHFGGCGCFSYPDCQSGVLSAAIGFK